MNISAPSSSTVNSAYNTGSTSGRTAAESRQAEQAKAAADRELKSAEEAKRNEQPKPVRNAEGQTTGTRISVTA